MLVISTYSFQCRVTAERRGDSSRGRRAEEEEQEIETREFNFETD